MNEDATASTASDTTDPLEAAVENFDLSGSDGGVSEESNQTADETVETDNTKETTTATNEEDTRQTESAESGKDQSDEVGKMTDKERNAYFAQRRIAAKEKDMDFIKSLRDEVKKDFVGEIDESEFEEMDDADASTARQLAEIQRTLRQQEADKAIEQVERARETTAFSILQAEKDIPMFNESSKDYNPELHKEALADWAEAYLITRPDQNGDLQILGVKDGAPTPHEYLTRKADIYTGLLRQAAARGQANAQRNRDIAETPTSGSSHRNSSSLEAIEDNIGDVPLADIR